MDAKHTKTPWRECPKSLPAHRFIIDQDRRIIADVGNSNGAIGGDTVQANAALIVLAVNAHDDLVSACRGAIEAIGVHGPCKNNSCRDCRAAWNRLYAALAKARGE